MARHLQEDVEAVLERARAQQVRPPVWKNSDRPAGAYDPQENVAGYAVRPRARASKRRRASTFNIVIALFITGICIVLYVSNVIAVNQLAYDVHEMETRLDKIRNTNAELVATINRKSSLERIGPMATEMLGLESPKEPPVAFPVDKDKLRELDEHMEAAGNR
jgi:cell division protein FtsL